MTFILGVPNLLTTLLLLSLLLLLLLSALSVFTASYEIQFYVVFN